MLTFLRSRKRSDLSIVCFVSQVRAKKPTHCVLLCKLYEEANSLPLLTSFRGSNRMFVDVFIEVSVSLSPSSNLHSEAKPNFARSLLL